MLPVTSAHAIATTLTEAIAEIERQTSLAGQLIAAGVDREVRGRDHAPVWVALTDTKSESSGSRFPEKGG